MSDKKTTVVKQDRNTGRWRDGSGKFTPTVLKPQPKVEPKRGQDRG